jgi:hypothetical protein
MPNSRHGQLIIINYCQCARSVRHAEASEQTKVTYHYFLSQSTTAYYDLINRLYQAYLIVYSSRVPSPELLISRWLVAIAVGY